MTDYELRRVPVNPGAIVDAIYDVVVDDVIVGRVISHPARTHGRITLAAGWSSHVYDPDADPADDEPDDVASRGAAHARTWTEAVENLFADRAAYIARRDAPPPVYPGAVCDDPWQTTIAEAVPW